jgi:amino acid transporter
MAMRAQGLPTEEGLELRKGALTLLDGTVIGVASTAPAYSLTAAISVLTAAIGVFAPSAMIVAFLPMLGVAVGFYWLNRRIPNCGTSYAWVARALNPALGFITGWVIIVADVVVMVSLAAVAAAATLTLFGQNANDQKLIFIIGLVWIVLMTWIVVIGIRVSAKLQWAMLGCEYVIVTGFCIWALINVFVNHPAGSHVPSITWAMPWQAPGGANAVLAAVLGAVFIYWGWDTAANVNEETENASDAPGLASVVSTVVLVIIYVFAAYAIAAYLPNGQIQSHSDDTLTYMAQRLAGNNKIWYLMVLAVTSSAAASTQTTILPTARVAFSMARDHVIPRAFAIIHPRFLTPWVATVAMGVVSGLLFAVTEWSSGAGNVVGDAVSASGLQIAFYYGLTGIAATWYYRRLLFTSASNLIFAGIFPLFGGLGFFYIGYEAALGLTTRQLWLGIGAMLVGIPLVIISWIAYPPFYRQPTDSAGPEDERPATATAEAR